MKIIFLCDSNSIHSAKYVNYFIDKNYECLLLSYSNSNITKCKNYIKLSSKKVKREGGNIHYLTKVFRIARIFYKYKPDIINSHFSYSYGFIAALAKKIARIKAKHVVVCHGSDILKPPFRLFTQLFNRYSLINADSIIAVSDQIYDDLISKYKINENKIYQIQYGVDKIKNIDTITKKIDILSNRPYIENSNLDILMEIINYISKEKKIKSIFVLPGSNEFIIKNLAKKYPFLTFLPTMNHSDMIELLKNTKIYVSATKSDGTSLSLLEAMQCATIPIVSNIPSNRSWIIDGVNGFLFRNKNELLYKINFALKNYDNLGLIINLNKKIVEEKGLYNKNIKKIEKYIVFGVRASSYLI